jgi:DNA-binding cell septation regulator SpoVG
MVQMPSESYKNKEGKTVYKDLTHPITAEARSEMNEKVIEAYNKEVGEEGSSSKKSGSKKPPF